MLRARLGLLGRWSRSQPMAPSSLGSPACRGRCPSCVSVSVSHAAWVGVLQRRRDSRGLSLHTPLCRVYTFVCKERAHEVREAGKFPDTPSAGGRPGRRWRKSINPRAGWMPPYPRGQAFLTPSPESLISSRNPPHRHTPKYH